MKAKQKLQSSDSHWFLFAMLPFFAAITALRNYRSAWAKNVIWAFVVFYGLTFSIAKENLIADQESDIVRYVVSLQQLYGKELTLSTGIEYFKESGEVDILQTIVIIVLSRFTDSQIALTATYGFIFGFFFSRNIWFIVERTSGKLKRMAILLMLVYFFVNPFWHINGFRFNTAVHVFMYGLLPYLYENKKSGILICASSILVHFTFMLPISVFLIYILLGNRLHLYFVFFIFSIFVNNINIAEFNKFIEDNMPEAFVERSKNYRSEEKVGEFRQAEEGGAVLTEEGWQRSKKNWYAQYYLSMLYFCETAILLFLFIMSRKIIRANKWLMNGFCFSLLIFGTANIMNSLPSGGRFYMLASLCVLSVVIFYVQNRPHEDQPVSKLLIGLSPLLLIFCIVALRTGFYSISVTTIVGNPFIALLTKYNLSLNDIIK